MKIKTYLKILGHGVLTGMIGVALWLTPLGMELEDNTGLNWLFKLRGVRKAPSDVVIVSIDKSSAEKLNLNNDPERWPRTMHAQVITELKKRNAALIVVNIGFDKYRQNDVEDTILKNAIENADNVILSDYLDPDIFSSHSIVKMIRPIESLRTAALDTAPFPLPRGQTDIKWAWLSLPSAGDLPTLPAVALNHFAIRNFFDRRSDFYKNLKGKRAELLDLLRKHRLQEDDADAQFVDFRDFYSNHPEFFEPYPIPTSGNELHISKVRILNAWMKLFRRDPSHFLNHYGSARAIKTVPYHRLIERTVSDETSFDGKVIFMGFSEDFIPEERLGFYNVFSREEGINISETELAATSFANLLDDSAINELDIVKQVLLLLVWGMLLAFICHANSLRLVVFGLALAASGYLLIARFQFTVFNSFWPFVIPLLVQSPCAMLACFLSRYLAIKRERDNVKHVFQNYLPPNEIKRLAEIRSSKDRWGVTDLMQGVCLYTDIEKYSTVAETMNPVEVKTLLDEYFSAIHKPIIRNSGFVSDIVGDAVLAIWATPTADKNARLAACRASLGILQAVEAFNQNSPVPLPTRIGIHYGQIALGHVGSADHREYRAVGDIVNTANRIEGLNKILGTRLLVSEDSIDQIDEIVTRELGTFPLRGKSQTLVVHEILGIQEDIDDATKALRKQFSEALMLFRSRQWHDAKSIFSRLLTTFPNDGPCVYYQQRCDECLCASEHGSFTNP